MKIYDFIVEQLSVKNTKDALFLLLKLIAAFIIAGEIYDGIRYFLSMIFPKAAVIELLLFCIKQALFIFILYLLCGPLKLFKAKVGLKGAVMILVVVSVLTYLVNGSVLGIYYIDGPYWGKVVDADTGKPIVGANVMGEWIFEWLYIIATVTSHADARETITDSKGWFFLTPGRKIWLWPISWISLKELRVYKPGYDSHPPRMHRAWSGADKEKWKEKLLKIRPNYRHDRTVDTNYFMTFIQLTKNIKIYKPTIIRLNKALTKKEKREASTGFNFSDVDYNRFKIKKFENEVKRRRRQ